MKTTLILGASSDTSRFAHRAQKKLMTAGHRVLPVTPKGGHILGIPVQESLDRVETPVDTVTIYLNPARVQDELGSLIKLKPRRIIFNPGSELATAAKELEKEGIEVVFDCTLLMLDGDRY